METQVLVVEDDAATAGFLADNLSADGFRVTVASAAGEGLRAVEVRQPDLVLLDLTLGDASGLRVLDAVRGADGTAARIDRDLPVIVLSGRAGEVDRVRGLRRGADDYLGKPFSYPELLARMQAVLRRSAARTQRGQIMLGELEIDPVSRRVTLAGAAVELAPKEFDLLRALASEPTRVWRKQELLRDVWHYGAVGISRTVDTHACKLRGKLTGGERTYVHAVRGVGYRLLGGEP